MKNRGEIIKYLKVFVIVVLVALIAYELLDCFVIKPSYIYGKKGYYSFAVGADTYYDADAKKYVSLKEKDIAEPFFNDGVAYFPIQLICKLSGVEYNYYSKYKIYAIKNKEDKTTLFMLDYDIMLCDNAGTYMDGKPIKKGDVVYLPQKQISEILGVECCYDNLNAVFTIGDTLYHDNLFKKNRVDIDESKYDEICDIADKYNKNKTDVAEAAFNRRLYICDSSGDFYNLRYSDDLNSQKTEVYNFYDAQPESCYIARDVNGESKMFELSDNGDETQVGEAPDVYYDKNLKQLKIDFFKTKYIKDLYGLDLSEKVSALQSALSSNTVKDKNEDVVYQYGDNSEEIRKYKIKLAKFMNEDINTDGDYDFYLFDLVTRFQIKEGLNVSGDLDKATIKAIDGAVNESDESYLGVSLSELSENKWNELCEKAKKGDVLLFINKNDKQYGLNTHCALIVDVEDNHTLHLLHARSNIYGVGSDKDMDHLNYEKLNTGDYWPLSQIATLYSFDGLSDEQRERITDDAEKKFNKYKFGFGYQFGFKQISCAELVNEAFKMQGYEISKDVKVQVNASYSAGRKEEQLQDIIFVPDNIMISDVMDMKCVWQR